MQEEQKSQPVTIEPPVSQTSTNTAPAANNSVLGILAATFYFGIALIGLTLKEVLDTSYDGGGLGFLIIGIFLLPPFLILSVISLKEILKARSKGESIGGARTIIKAVGFALAGLVVTAAIPLLSRVWDSFF